MVFMLDGSHAAWTHTRSRVGLYTYIASIVYNKVGETFEHFLEYHKCHVRT